MRRAFRLVMGYFPTAATFGAAVSAVLAVGALTVLGSPHTAWAAESSRGLHFIPGAPGDPELVLASDGTPWFIGIDRVVHVTPDGRVVRYRLPASSLPGAAAWGADGALWAVDTTIRGLIRVAPNGRYTRFRDVWATRRTETSPCCMIAGPDGKLWLDYGNRILSVAADTPARVIATVGRQFEPVLLATGLDGSVWFSLLGGSQGEITGLQRVLPDGHVEAIRYRNSDIESASVAPNGDVWFIRSELDSDLIIVKRTRVVRIDRGGRVTEFPAPRITPVQITAAADGTVWIAGYNENTGNILARMDRTGRFERIFRAPGWAVTQMRVAPDGRLWLASNTFQADSAAWLPPDPCLSRRRITVHPHSRRDDPIRRVRLSVQGRFPHTFHGRRRRIPIDLRGYLPGAVGVTLKIRTAHNRRTRHLVFHTCRFSG
jgi:streptogramin lyase